MAKIIQMQFDGLVLLACIRRPTGAPEPITMVTLTDPEQQARKDRPHASAPQRQRKARRMAAMHSPKLLIRNDLVPNSLPPLKRMSVEPGYTAFDLSGTELRFPMANGTMVPPDRDDDDESHIVATPITACGDWNGNGGPLSHVADAGALSGGRIRSGVVDSYPPTAGVTARIVLSGGRIRALPNGRRSRVYWNFTPDSNPPDTVQTMSDSVLLEYNTGDSGVLALDVVSLTDGKKTGEVIVPCGAGSGLPQIAVTSLPEPPGDSMDGAELTHFLTYYKFLEDSHGHSVTGPVPKYYGDCAGHFFRKKLAEWLKDVHSQNPVSVRTSPEGPCPNALAHFYLTATESDM